jgi:hypothetical protein
MSSIIRATTTSGLQVAPDNSGSLQLQTNGTTAALTIDTSQNVGIGTSSPSSILDVKAATSIIKNTSTTGTNSTQYWVSNTGGNFYVALDSSTGSSFGAAYGAALWHSGAYPILFATNNTERMRIDSSGNVGIGTSSPAYQLVISNGGGAGLEIGPVGLSSAPFIQAYNRSGAAYVQMAFDALQYVWRTSGTERMRIDSSGYAQGTVNGLSAGRMLAWQYYRLNSGYAGSNATGAQSVFGVGVTLVGSTQYEFEAVIALSKSAGVTSHTLSLGFGGTATLNNIGYEAIWTRGATSFTDTGVGTVSFYIATASATAFGAATTTAAEYYQFLIKGTVSVNAGGTFIPQYTLSAAPGGAYTTAIGSYIKISPLAASGANVNVGSWA